MTWKTHVLGGVSSLWLLVIIPGAITVSAFSSVVSSDSSPAAANIGMLVTIAALGALLPDLDAHDSKIRHLNVLAGIEPFVLPGRALHRLLGHRGLLHSAQGIALCALFLSLPISLWLGWQAGTALLLGYSSHIALDACTKTGVPLLFPDPRRFWLVPPRLRVVTGSPDEEAVLIVLAVLALLLLLLVLRQTSATIG